MTSIGRFTSSAVSAVSELTVAAASLNFDFSIVKVEAPQEFHELGQVLSHGRRREAEDGELHNTARRLAALFGPLLTPTPGLFKAYGTRSSEIVSSRDVNPLGSKEDHGLFFEQVGADCTSIWAAATSGHSAVAMHLLACMLARIWEPDEAISVWVDIVTARKREIQADENLGGLEKLALDAATRQQISREQLAQWDTSARAWLRCADEAKGIKRKQTQLLLILKNIAIAVNSITDTYKSVMQAWKSAMTLVENLLLGQPQEVRDGAILLGLSAWHLFPDLIVLGSTVTQVKQRDPLVAQGGILTVGIADTHSDQAHRGISWSLPLASLNFYGDPVTSTQTLDPDTPRLTGRDLSYLGLGSLLFEWDLPSTTASQAIECLVEMWAFLCRNIEGFSLQSVPTEGSVESDSFEVRRWKWLKMLCDAARAFLDTQGVERERACRLLQFGRRRAEQFLSYDGHLKTDFLGLLDSRKFIGSLRDTETKVSYLRQWASRSISDQDTIIQYSVTNPSTLSETRYRRSSASKLVDETTKLEATLPDGTTKLKETYVHFEYATAIETKCLSLKRDSRGVEIPTTSHKRWIAIVSENHGISSSGKCICERNEPNTCNCTSHLPSSVWKNNSSKPGLIENRSSSLSYTGETIVLDEQRVTYSDPTYDFEFLTWHGWPQTLNNRTQPSTKEQTYNFLWGKPGDAAIFMDWKEDRGGLMGEDLSSKFLSLWISALKSDAIRPESLKDILDVAMRENKDYFTAIDALSIAYEIFEDMPGATIDPKVTSQPLKDTQWYISYATSQHLAWEKTREEARKRVGSLAGMTLEEGCVPAWHMPLTRWEIFSCVAYFDTDQSALSAQPTTSCALQVVLSTTNQRSATPSSMQQNQFTGAPKENPDEDAIPFRGMVSSFDFGNDNDLHPFDSRPITQAMLSKRVDHLDKLPRPAYAAIANCLKSH
ncbi:hypothetical protein FPOAC1_012355 [Fusarium poae]|uniref:hypothetical protein n=1 Tax=Fusarium poae TaxID=36050 RepID=UPI001CEB4B0E|nr:hypothetical protein FPOAC1_012355 [Fusarium poae]KAG8667522.1 hypothetical protein FPOAC1_012355 [Fusarium poae]